MRPSHKNKLVHECSYLPLFFPPNYIQRPFVLVAQIFAPYVMMDDTARLFLHREHAERSIGAFCSKKPAFFSITVFDFFHIIQT